MKPKILLLLALAFLLIISPAFAAKKIKSLPAEKRPILQQPIATKEGGSKMSFVEKFSLGMDLLGYQEHASNVTMNNVTGNLDSNASPSFISLGGKLEMPWQNLFFGMSGIVPITKTVVTETWKMNGNDFQTNDLSYTLTSVDLYGGYTVSNLIEPFSGIRIARGEQIRENFYINNAKQNTGTSTELITSMNIFAGLRGNNKATPLSFGYNALVLYPLSVSTTNNLLPGFNFGASGYTLSLSGNASYCVFGGSFLVCEIGYGLVHYSGSGWAVQGQQQAQWPINDTQDLNVTLGWTSDL